MASGLAHRERQRAATRRAGPSSTTGGATGECSSISAGAPPRTPPSSTTTQPVRERDHPLHPVLGDQHGQPQVVHQPGQHAEHVLGGGRVEGRGRLVEHQQPGVHRQHGPDRHPLLLTARERRQRPGAQVGDAQHVEGLLDPPPHGLAVQAELLHAVGQLVLDGLGDEAGERVLPDVPDEVGELARRPAADALRPPAARRRARCPPVKRGTSPLTVASSVDLPEPVRPATSTSSASSTRRCSTVRAGACCPS